MDLEELKKSITGDWLSIAPEVRPGAQKNADGSIKPFYLSREFSYAVGERFKLKIINSVDPYGKIPMAEILIEGHISWEGQHPIAEGAQKVNFTADTAYQVRPLIQGFADILNQVAKDGYSPWTVGGSQSVFGKSFPPFGLVSGTNFMEYDLIYLFKDLLFWGARNVDGKGFDTEEHRPTNLQIPMYRK